MADHAPRRGAVDLGVPLMILAFVIMGGFLYWLNVRAAEERSLEVVEDTTAANNDPSRPTTIPAADIQLDATPYEGQVVRVAGLGVASRLGQQGFWLTLPNNNPFLVSLSEEASAAGAPPAAGDTVSVTGTVMAMNDSILNAWTQAGTIGEGDRLAAEFATHFIEATNVERGTGGTRPDTSR